MVKRCVLRGTSMMPFLKPGDVLLVAPVSDREIKRFQIVAFRREGCQEPVVHRVVKVVGDARGCHFVTKGDGVKVVDGPVAPGEVLGRVVGKVVKGRVERFHPMKEALTYYGSQVYWTARRWLGRFFYRLLDLILPYLNKSTVLIPLSSGFTIKAVVWGRVIAWRTVDETGEYYWCSPLLSLSRRKELLEILSKSPKGMPWTELDEGML